ncbi:MAG: expansin-like protein [Reichenbachiella sp.]
MLGDPFGACGVPLAVLEYDAQDSALVGLSEVNFVALNVFDSPQNYQEPGAFGPRPLVGDALQSMGMYSNGFNCGRWIEITMGDECDSQFENSGRIGTSVCNDNQGWYSDDYNGAKMYAIVTDQCSDGNMWCRDSRGHLDIHTESLNAFQYEDGTYVDPIAVFTEHDQWHTKAYNNRKVSWKFVNTPKYRGDIHIWYTEGSKEEWKRVLITNLPNGISGVAQGLIDAQGDTTWADARQEGDMGQQWILPDPQQIETIIKVKDVDGNFVFDGRIYNAPFPAACGIECTVGATISLDNDDAYPGVLIGDSLYPDSESSSSEELSSKTQMSSSSIVDNSSSHDISLSSSSSISSNGEILSSSSAIESSNDNTSDLFVRPHEFFVPDGVVYDIMGRKTLFCSVCIVR